MEKKEVKKEVKKVEPKAFALEEVPHTGTLDLKESKEMLQGLLLITGSVKEVMADGKIGWDDAAVGVKLAQKFSVFAEAAKDIKLIPDELKDLNEIEMLELASAVFPLLKDLKEIVLLAKNWGK